MTEQPKRQLRPYLSARGAWAYSLGTAIGWGSLVITANTYLMQAGPLGTVLGLAVGALIMLIMACNYHYMINVCPEAGGVYAYTRNAFGYDYGFVVAWFLSLTYLAMLWANATSLPLFARYFVGDIFRFGYLYTLFGYDVYLGEALLTIAAIALAGLLCMRSKRGVSALMVVLAGFFTLGITACFAGALLKGGRVASPSFVPDSKALRQIVRIACISPWAFIGFENISHAAEGFSFSHRKTFRVLAAVLLTSALLYVFVTLLSVTAYPPEYGGWLEYIRDLGNLDGIKDLPAFYAAEHYLGNTGVIILMLSLLSLILTSLFGNIMALSRLFYALAKDRVLPRRVADLNKWEIPWKAIALTACISLIMPFAGRMAIDWIVDVTTIGATIIYGAVSACALKTAIVQQDRLEKWTGAVGAGIMILFLLYLLVPNLFTSGVMGTETYFLFVIWAILGFVYFRVILGHDKEKRFGKSVITWIVLLSLVLFVSLSWMNQSMMNEAESVLDQVQAHYNVLGFAGAQGSFALDKLAEIRALNAQRILAVVLLFGLALSVLMNNFSVISKRADRSEAERDVARDLAHRDPLTGVKSRHAYIEKEKEMDALVESGQAPPFAVAVLDVNGLKQINDTYGHKAGDQQICSAFQIICDCFQHSPVYRPGGDEFVVVLTGRDYENRAALLEGLKWQMEQNAAGGGIVIACGASDYIAGQDVRVKNVMEHADTMMYQHKKELKAIGAVTC